VGPRRGMTALVTEQGRRPLDGARQRLSPESSVLEILKSGDPSIEIAKTAKAWPADPIVIGSHGRGGLDRKVVASVAESVTCHAPCPVFIIGPRE
jgi:universal stress protein A